MTYMLYKKNLYTHTVCNTYYKCKKLADNITSIKIGLSCTAYILLMLWSSMVYCDNINNTRIEYSLNFKPNFHEEFEQIKKNLSVLTMVETLRLPAL